MSRPAFLVCQGSHCRKKLARDQRVLQRLDELGADVSRVGCQKVCQGPVIGTRLEGSWQWFERMDSRKALEALEDFVRDGRLRKPLAKRLNSKRAGKRRS